jgi:hypothetical protein
MMNRLTAVKVQKIAGRGRYADGGGLYLQVSEWGTKAWLFRYKLDGKARQMGLGSVNTFSLAEARERARLARQLLADHLDPIDARRGRRMQGKAEAAKQVRFKEAAEKYIAAHRAGWKSEVHAGQWATTLKTYAYPVVGDLSVAAIETAHVLKVLEPIWASRTETASRLRGRIEAVLDWATARQLRQGENPRAGAAISTSCFRRKRRSARSSITTRCLTATCRRSWRSCEQWTVCLRGRSSSPS